MVIFMIVVFNFDVARGGIKLQFAVHMSICGFGVFDFDATKSFIMIELFVQITIFGSSVFDFDFVQSGIMALFFFHVIDFGVDLGVAYDFSAADFGFFFAIGQ